MVSTLEQRLSKWWPVSDVASLQSRLLSALLKVSFLFKSWLNTENQHELAKSCSVLTFKHLAQELLLAAIQNKRASLGKKWFSPNIPWQNAPKALCPKSWQNASKQSLQHHQPPARIPYLLVLYLSLSLFSCNHISHYF